MQMVVPTWLVYGVMISHVVLLVIALVMLFRRSQSGLSLLAQVLILLNIPILGPALVIWKNRA